MCCDAFMAHVDLEAGYQRHCHGLAVQFVVFRCRQVLGFLEFEDGDAEAEIVLLVAGFGEHPRKEENVSTP